MTPRQIYLMLTGIDSSVPVAHYRFLNTQDQPAPAPPFICYFYPNSDDFFADDANYQGIAELVVELYTDFKDLDLESKVEETLSAHELAWVKEESYLDDQRMHMTTWTTEVVLNTNGGKTNA